MAYQLGDHLTTQQIIVIEFDAAIYRQTVRIEMFVVFIQGLHVLTVSIAHHTDCSDAQGHQVTVGMRRIALEIAIQRALSLRHRQFVVGLGKVIHADIDIARHGQLVDGHLQYVELLRRRG